MFEDCKTDVEKHTYKRSKQLQKEADVWLKQYQPDFYRAQRTGSYNDVFDGICDLVEIPEKKGRFLHFVDYRYLFDTTRGYRFDNLTPDFRIVLDHGLEELKYPLEEITDDFCRDYNRTIDALIRLTERIEVTLRRAGERESAEWFHDFALKPAEGLAEALQRILFADQMIWQMGSRLIGLGRLDRMLWDFYTRDVESGKLSKDEALELLCDFLRELHKYYWLKSNVLMGDTGQIVILGGKNADGQYGCNELTYLLIEAVMRLGLPDPKILLRVSADMPEELMRLALKCMQTGVGSPILSNDDVVIPRLLDFGIEKADACEYGTSACWEPLIPGKSISQNNIDSLSYPRALQRTVETAEYMQETDFEAWMAHFYKELDGELVWLLDRIADYRLQYNPLLSVFIRDCREKKADASCGGARYCNYGITTVGLANTVNALMNLKKLVFEQKQYTLQQVFAVLNDNFAEDEQLQKLLKELKPRYGEDDPAVIDLTNAILHHSTLFVKDYRNYMGGRLKLGVSSPAYIDAARDFPATFDGRKKGEPFAVHISSDCGNGYTEIINFAGALDYGENRFNGNVVDFMVAPHFIEMNFDKMTDLLMAGIKVGFFQLQMNVIGSETLIAAKAHPEDYRDLVVRVWGFSAYFHDLPEEYQDVLIQRALQNERRAS